MCFHRQLTKLQQSTFYIHSKRYSQFYHANLKVKQLIYCQGHLEDFY